MAIETVEEAWALDQSAYDAMSWEEYIDLSDEVLAVLAEREQRGELK